ncbi:MAG: hypothetical protein NT031_16870, partial [Planctomycetota bacterium]|nr:hypothetical protein [Planctomycetota bacterium]
MMNHLPHVLGCLVIGLASVAASGAIIIWDFNPANQKGALGSSTESVHGSATGLVPLDLATPLVTVAGFNADGTPRKLYWKTARASEHGIGLVGTNGHELTLKNKGSAYANYMRIDVTGLLDLNLGDLQIRMQ